MNRLRKAVRIFKPSADSENFKFVVIVAGEASADLHGSNLVRAMRSMDPDIVFWGIGGEKMENAGVKILVSSSEMAVVGLTEVLFRLRAIVRAFWKLKSLFKHRHPDLLILIDYPDFNIHIARTAKRFQVPVLYYVSPQVWAWRKGRVRKIADRVDRMVVILPFEEAFYRQRGLNVEYVGHPLLDIVPAEIDKNEARLRLGLGHGRPVVGLLPGSRKEEIKKLLPVMVHAAEILRKRYHSVQFLLPLAPTIEPAFARSLVDDTGVEIKFYRKDVYSVLSACDLALVASGTATLETAIMEVPMVIAYKVSRVSYWAAKMAVRVPFIGLVNLVAGEGVVPELIQDEVSAERLAHEALIILEREDVRKRMVEKLKGVKKSLGKGGASRAAAGIALHMMGIVQR